MIGSALYSRALLMEFRPLLTGYWALLAGYRALLLYEALVIGRALYSRAVPAQECRNRFPKEAYFLPKEPCFLPKEPYILP